MKEVSVCESCSEINTFCECEEISFPYDPLLRAYNEFINDKYCGKIGLAENDVEEFKLKLKNKIR